MESPFPKKITSKRQLPDFMLMECRFVFFASYTILYQPSSMMYIFFYVILITIAIFPRSKLAIIRAHYIIFVSRHYVYNFLHTSTELRFFLFFLESPAYYKFFTLVFSVPLAQIFHVSRICDCPELDTILYLSCILVLVTVIEICYYSCILTCTTHNRVQSRSPIRDIVDLCDVLRINLLAQINKM